MNHNAPATFQPPKETDHQIPRLFSRPDRIADPLYVITPLFNSRRFRSRWKLYEDFAQEVHSRGAILHTIEVAFGARDFVVTDQVNSRHTRMRTMHEIWLKEQTINLAVQRLPSDWKYVAWVDADVTFARPDWADETKHLLQHHPVIQMWSQLHDMDSKHELMGTCTSFADGWVRGLLDNPAPTTPTYQYPSRQRGGRSYPGAPGLAWAMERDAWNQLGGLIDCCILGAGDWYMAYALIGHLDKVIPAEMNANLVAKLREWENRAKTSKWHERPIAGNLGVMSGVAFHHWHGPKVLRRYKSREKILYRNDYNPDTDLKVDSQGLYQLTGRCPELRRDIQRYFSERDEDLT